MKKGELYIEYVPQYIPYHPQDTWNVCKYAGRVGGLCCHYVLKQFTNEEEANEFLRKEKKNES